MSAAMLLVETLDGAVVALRFPSVEAAREWEDRHEDRVYARGAFRVVTRAEALRLSDPAAVAS